MLPAHYRCDVLVSLLQHVQQPLHRSFLKRTNKRQVAIDITRTEYVDLDITLGLL